MGSAVSSPIPETVATGGTGKTSLTAFAPLFGGTTSTAPIQSGTVGTAGQVLTSNGDGVLPTFQAAAGGGIGGSTGATDNAILRADGTGGATAQNSLVTIDDQGGMRGCLVVRASLSTTMTQSNVGTWWAPSLSSGGETYNLPASPGTGWNYGFVCLAAGDPITVQAQGSHVIWIGGSASSAAGTATSSTKGSTLLLVYVSSNLWMGFSAGTWALA